MLVHLILFMKATKILCYWFLLSDSFNFCETHFTTHQRFVADHSAISPFLGGKLPALKFEILEDSPKVAHFHVFWGEEENRKFLPIAL